MNLLNEKEWKEMRRRNFPEGCWRVKKKGGKRLKELILQVDDMTAPIKRSF